MIMELNKIKSLLNEYLEGNTTVEQEVQLRKYFQNEEVAEELLSYKKLFAAFDEARQEKSVREIKLPTKKSNKIKSWWYAVAAVLILAIGVGGMQFSQIQKEKEQEALVALKKTREAMLFLSENLNKGTEHLIIVNQFEIAKDKILKE